MAPLPHPGRLIILYRSGSPAARIQLEPVRRVLRSQPPGNLHIDFQEIPGTAEAVESLRPVLSNGPPVRSVWFQLDWRVSEEETTCVARRLRDLLTDYAPGATLVALDPFDDTTTGRYGTFEHVDLYVKKQVPVSPLDWPATLKGGMIVSDYTVSHLGGTAAPVDSGHHRLAEQRDKVHVGPNIASGDYVRHLLRGKWPLGRLRWRLRNVPRRVAAWEERPIDVLCRLSLGSVGLGDWYHAHRMRCLEALMPLEGRYHVVAGAPGVNGFANVSRRRFYAEMHAARICVSPFGYGELCYRDFEAMACGCLLVKPDVSHVLTRPDLLVPGETYVPVRWDYSDLAEVVDRCLGDAETSKRIAVEARRRLAEYHVRGIEKDVQCLLAASVASQQQ